MGERENEGYGLKSAVGRGTESYVILNLPNAGEGFANSDLPLKIIHIIVITDILYHFSG